MKTICIVGTQWGDEGKGKITDYLAQKSDCVVRSQGGNNAGHSIEFLGKKYSLRSIPSGIFIKSIKNIMANGMVINPESLLEEIEELQKSGINTNNLFISNRAHVIMPYHIDLDGAYENFKKEFKIGTTKKGIGPCYSDKINRIGIRFGDLLDYDNLSNILDNFLPIKNKELSLFGLKEYDKQTLLDKYYKYGQILKNHITDTSILLNNEIKNGKKVLFEGAQGGMLCIDYGTYPFVTSSSPTSASIPINCGISYNLLEHTIGIVKAYTTRVGEGHFVTEINDDIASYIREKGHEYGTVTKRPRRIGYLDLVVVNQAIRISGIKSICLMLLDVLSNIDELKICTSYELDGRVIDYIPSTIKEYERCKAVYITTKGFNSDISQIKEFDNLPKEAKDYIYLIEKYTNVSVDIISVGADRNSTIVRKEFF